MMKLSELEQREVVNLADGRNLGHINDVEINVERARISAIIVPRKIGGWACLVKHEEQVIPWECIVRIGRDVILVDLDEAGVDAHDPEHIYNRRCLPCHDRG